MAPRMSLDQFGVLIGTVGFPIAVAGYVLIRLEKTLKDLTREIQNLRGCLDRLGPRRRHAAPQD